VVRLKTWGNQRAEPANSSSCGPTKSKRPKELDDNLSRNSSPQRQGHPKAKVEGAKSGRPPTAEGQAKKEVAAKTGQTLRTTQRATSEKPKAETARKKTPADPDSARIGRKDQIDHHIREITEILSACDRGDRDMIRRSFTPLLDGWFGEDGMLREPTGLTDHELVAGQKFEPSPADRMDDADRDGGQLEAGAEVPLSPMNRPTGEAALLPAVGAGT
jgi:hypothetical protein